MQMTRASGSTGGTTSTSAAGSVSPPGGRDRCPAASAQKAASGASTVTSVPSSDSAATCTAPSRSRIPTICTGLSCLVAPGRRGPPGLDGAWVGTVSGGSRRRTGRGGGELGGGGPAAPGERADDQRAEQRGDGEARRARRQGAARADEEGAVAGPGDRAEPADAQCPAEPGGPGRRW